MEFPLNIFVLFGGGKKAEPSTHFVNRTFTLISFSEIAILQQRKVLAIFSNCPNLLLLIVVVYNGMALEIFVASSSLNIKTRKRLVRFTNNRNINKPLNDDFLLPTCKNVVCT